MAKVEKIKFDEEGFAEQMVKDVEFTEADIEQHFYRQAALYAYYSHQAMLAQKAVDKLKLTLDALEGQLDKAIRDKAVSEGQKITETSISQAISRNEKYVTAAMKLNDAKASASMLRDYLDALKQKKDCLIHIGLTMRDELKAKATVKAVTKASAYAEDDQH